MGFRKIWAKGLTRRTNTLCISFKTGERIGSRLPAVYRVVINCKYRLCEKEVHKQMEDALLNQFDDHFGEKNGLNIEWIREQLNLSGGFALDKYHSDRARRIARTNREYTRSLVSTFCTRPSDAANSITRCTPHPQLQPET